MMQAGLQCHHLGGEEAIELLSITPLVQQVLNGHPKVLKSTSRGSLVIHPNLSWQVGFLIHRRDHWLALRRAHRQRLLCLGST